MNSMKRMREEDREVEALAMANCLMLLSRAGATSAASTGGRVFACKTCQREFSSFQALGGHRASHKKPRLMGGSGDDLRIESPAAKPKSHECSICGVEFAIGQALGGHMRRHRLNNALSSHSADNNSSDDSKSVEAMPVLKKTNSSGRGKRVLLCLDLNLTPLENHIKKINMLSSSSSSFSSRLIA